MSVHVNINNTNRFIRDNTSPDRLHQNIDNEARIPAKTICGMEIADPLYFNEMKTIEANPMTRIGECAVCHEGILK